MVCQKYLQILCVILVTGLVRGQTATTGTGTPSVVPNTGTPSVVPNTGTPSVVPNTGTPSVVPNTGPGTPAVVTDAPTTPPVTPSQPTPLITDAPITPPVTPSGPSSPPPELSTEGIILTCTPTQMIVEIPKSRLTDGMTGDDVCFENQLEDDNSECRGKWKTSAANIIEVTTNLTACGTEMKETNETETYTNRVVNRYDNEDGISRHYVIDIPISCSYNRSRRVGSISYNLTDYTIDKELEGESAYTFSFDIYTDSDYTEKAGPYPTTVNIGLNEELYFAASVLSLDGTLDLSIRSCRATPDSDYESSPKMFEFIEKGCPEDDTTNIIILEDHYRIGVNMKTFRFVDETAWVYIHCNLLVCNAADVDSVCNGDCASNSSAIMGRKRRDVRGELKTQRFTRGPLRVVRSAQRQGSVLSKDVSENGAATQQEVTNAFNPWIVAIAALATVVMAMAAMMAVVLRKVSKISAAPAGYKEASARLLDDKEEI